MDLHRDLPGSHVLVHDTQYHERRVLLVEVRARPAGSVVLFKGGAWQRVDEELHTMDDARIRHIHLSEHSPDFSAEVCSGAGFDDLSPDAIADFERRWQRKSGGRLNWPDSRQMLSDAELIVNDGVTYAALILLAKPESLSRLLPEAEIIFEYRSAEASTRYQERLEFREGFLLCQDALWEALNKRNEAQQFQQGLFIGEIPTFNEDVVREALLNAVAHRDYRKRGSIFVRQYPRILHISSPGGFPEGVTPENILEKSVWRNRRLAEALSKCGFVERSGQGADKMFRTSIQEGKSIPDYSASDPHEVVLRLDGNIQDPRFLGFLERVSRQRGRAFDLQDLLVVDLVHRSKEIPPHLKLVRDRLIPDVIEPVGRTRARRYILSKEFYDHVRSPGEYTRRKGLGRDAHKELMLRHLSRIYPKGAGRDELHEVLPMLKGQDVGRLLQELKSQGKVRVQGRTRAAKWFYNSEYS